MERIVVDSNIIVASFLEWQDFHQRSREYINALERGDYLFHLPMLVVVEVMSAISRQAQTNRLPLLARARKSLSDWERDGKIILYELDRDRTNNAVNIAEQSRLRGADAVIAALAEELDIPLKTFDAEVLARFLGASV